MCLFCAGGFGGCDCGEPERPDGGDEQDAGRRFDAWLPDTARPDQGGRDTARPDQEAPDTTLPDTTVPDVTAGDLAAADLVGEDAATDAAPPEDSGIDDAPVTDGPATDAAEGDAAQVDTALPDTTPFDHAGPHDPNANAGPNIQVLPGVMNQPLEGSFTDFDTEDTHTVSWALQGGGSPPPGVYINNTAFPTAQLTVDRSSYDSGPESYLLTLVFTVTDNTGRSDSDTMRVTILDERGPYVDNTSSYEGIGYDESGDRHGYCGAQAHPCNNMEDALVNLRGAIDDGASDDPWIKVATTDTSFERSEALQLDNGIGLECGYDPATWERPETPDPTRIYFDGAMGIHATTDVRIVGCHVEGAASPSPVEERIAIFGDQAVLEVRECSLVANLPSGPSTVVGLRLDSPAADARSIVADCEIDGGISSDLSIGVDVIGGVPLIDGCFIGGGRAATAIGVQIAADVGGAGPHATIQGSEVLGGSSPGETFPEGSYGIWILSGDVDVLDNDIAGARSPDNSAMSYGVRIQGTEEAAPATLSGNSIFGHMDEGTPEGALRAIGLRLEGAALLQDNPVIHGGAAGKAIGVLLLSGAVLESTGDTIEGGTSWDADPESFSDDQVIGVDVNLEAQATFTDTEVFGVAANAEVAPATSTGAIIWNWSYLTFNGGLIVAGDADKYSYGVNIAGAIGEVTLTDAAVAAGDVADPEGRSMGVHHAGASFVATGGTITGGQGMKSYGIETRRQGGASGIALTSLTGVEVVAGSAVGDDIGETISAGIYHTNGQLLIDGGSVTGGPSDGNSVGIWMDTVDDDTSHSIESAEIHSGAAHFTTGLIIVETTGTVALADNTITTAVGQATATGAVYDNADVTMSNDTITTGDTVSMGTAIGVQVLEATLDADGVEAEAGEGFNSRGLEADATTACSWSGGRIESRGAGAESHGILVGGSSSNVAINGTEVVSGPAHSSMAARLIEDTQDSDIIGSTLTTGTGQGLTMGLSIINCLGCRITGNTITAGAATNEDGSSSGVATTYTEPFTDVATEMTYFYNNRITAGAASRSSGINANGDPQGSVRFMHNNIDGGGQEGGTSYGVLAGIIFVTTDDEVGVFVGNIIDPGDGSSGGQRAVPQAYHFYENCIEGWGAAQPTAAANNNLLPEEMEASTYYLRTTGYSAGSCTRGIETSNLSTINGAAPYDAGTNYDHDPDFLSDGYHISMDTPLRDLSEETPTYWPRTWTLRDIDASPRPIGDGYEIGCDEVSARP